MLRRQGAFLWNYVSNNVAGNVKCLRFQFSTLSVQSDIVPLSAEHQGHKLLAPSLTPQLKLKIDNLKNCIANEDYQQFIQVLKRLEPDDFRSLDMNEIEQVVQMTTLNCDPISGFQQILYIQEQLKKAARVEFESSSNVQCVRLFTMMRAVAWSKKHGLQVDWTPRDVFRLTRQLSRQRQLTQSQYFHLCSFMISNGLYGEARTEWKRATGEHGVDQDKHESLIRQSLKVNVSYIALKLLLELLKNRMKPSVPLAMTAVNVIYNVTWGLDVLQKAIESDDFGLEEVEYLQNILMMIRLQRGKPASLDLEKLSVNELEGVILALMTSAPIATQSNRQQSLEKNDEILQVYSIIWKKSPPASKYIHHQLLRYFHHMTIRRQDTSIRRQFERLFAFILESNRPLYVLLDRRDLPIILDTAARLKSHAVFKGVYVQIISERGSYQWLAEEKGIMLRAAENALASADKSFVVAIYHDWIANHRKLDKVLVNTVLKSQPIDAVIEHLYDLARAEGVLTVGLQQAYSFVLDTTLQDLILGDQNTHIEIYQTKAQDLLARLMTLDEIPLPTIYVVLQRILSMTRFDGKPMPKLYEMAIDILANRNDVKGCVEVFDYALSRNIVLSSKSIEQIVEMHLPDPVNTTRFLCNVITRQQKLPGLECLYKLYQAASDLDKGKLMSLVENYGTEKDVERITHSSISPASL